MALRSLSGYALSFCALLSLSLLTGTVLLLAPPAAAKDCQNWYRDRDGDGYGDPDASAGRSSCEPLPGYVANRSDCNDFSASIYPNAPGAWWAIDGDADCSRPEPAEDALLYVNCPVCESGDPLCLNSRSICTNPAGCSFDNIQDAIDASRDGATIEVCQGIYHERIDFLGKAIHVRGRLTHSVVLAGDGSGLPTVTFDSGEDEGSRLSRVVITPGNHGELGGGVFIQNASPVLDRINFVNNAMYDRGGALSILANRGKTASPVIRDSGFTGNRTLDGELGLGGAVGILAYGRDSIATPVFEDVVFADNAAMSGGAFHAAASSGGYVAPSLTRARFVRNSASRTGSAIALDAWLAGGALNLTNVILEKNTTATEAVYLRVQKGTLPVRVLNSTFVGNDAVEGVIRGDAGPHAGSIDLTLENSILAFNFATHAVVALSARGTGPTVAGHYHYNDLYSNGYNGTPWSVAADASHNLVFDPRFKRYSMLSALLSDLTLSAGSPAADAGNPDAAYNDLTGTRNDLGAYGGPAATWPAFLPPYVSAVESPDPDLDEMALARRFDLELLTVAPASITCEEVMLDGRRGEALYFSGLEGITPRLDLLGLKADTSYQCFLIASNTGGMGSYGVEIFTPPLPLDLQNLWTVTDRKEGAEAGYTLFNVFPTSFTPHYIVLVDMQGEIRWYYTMFDALTSEFDPVTPDTAVEFIPETAQVLFGGGESVAHAMPQLVPLAPADAEPLANLTCASQQDPIHQVCAGIEGSDLPDEFPHHDTIRTVDGNRLMYLCTEWVPAEGATPEQYCRDSSYRYEGFSIEEWDISNPTVPVNTWRWSGRDATANCQLPSLPGETDPYHANALWREEESNGNTSIYVSLRHRNQVMKIDRASKEVVWKLGPSRDEDICPADYAPDPTQCLGYDPAATVCAGRYYPRFELEHDQEDVTCPDTTAYEGPEELDPQWFYGQHAPWLQKNEDGTRTVYMHDNGRNSPDNVADPESRLYTRAVRMRIDDEAMVAKVEWQYCRGTEVGEPTAWWAPAWGSAYPVQEKDGSLTGNVLVASSHCTVCSRLDGDVDSEDSFLAEVSEDKQVLWGLNLGQDHGVYRAQRIDGCYRLPGRRDFLMGTGIYCGELTPRAPQVDPS